jgi:hypothetical protein
MKVPIIVGVMLLLNIVVSGATLIAVLEWWGR